MTTTNLGSTLPGGAPRAPSSWRKEGRKDPFVVPTGPIVSRPLHPPSSTLPPPSLAAVEGRSPLTEGPVGSAPAPSRDRTIHHRPIFLRPGWTYGALASAGRRAGNASKMHDLPTREANFFFGGGFAAAVAAGLLPHIPAGPHTARLPPPLFLPSSSPPPPPSRASRVDDEGSKMCHGSEDEWPLGRWETDLGLAHPPHPPSPQTRSTPRNPHHQPQRPATLPRCPLLSPAAGR